MSLSRDEAYDACLATLRETDMDRYLACLLMPQERRGAIAALYAYNAELARVRDMIREPMAGELRLQWWRDCVSGEARGDVMGHPVAAGLMFAVEAYDLPRQPLVAMTEARIFDLYDDPMQSTTMFEGYAGETASSLIQLTALVLAGEKAREAADAAGHAGVAQLVAGALLLLPLHQGRQQVFLPADILAATGLDPAAFLRGADRDRIAAAISAFVGFGRDHLAKARQARLPADVFDAFLPVSLAEPIFDRVERAGAAAMESSQQLSQLRRQWRLWRASRRRTF